MLHLGTIAYGLREFIVMTCIKGPYKGRTYIEEVVLNTIDFSKDVFANCKFIEDDNLAMDLVKYAEENGITDIPKRLNELGDSRRLSWMKGSQR
jgi:hypothetical protein